MKPEQYFEQSLREKYSEAVKATDSCIQLFLTNRADDAKQKQAVLAFKAVETLFDLLPRQHRPLWLNQLKSSLNTLKASPFSPTSLSAATSIATQLYPQMRGHDWRFDDGNDNGFDFDRIYEDYRDQNRISELFDEIVGWLQQIIDSGEIDSIRAVNELNHMIATLLAARAGSYFATRGAWYFFTQWMQNTGWELMGDIPVLGAAVRGLKQTLDDTNTAMEKMHNGIDAEFNENLTENFPRLEYKPPALPAPEAEPDVIVEPE